MHSRQAYSLPVIIESKWNREGSLFFYILVCVASCVGTEKECYCVRVCS